MTEHPFAEVIDRSVTERAGDVIGLSHDLHARPELAFEEHDAARWCGQRLSDLGLDVDAGIAGLPTAFRATIGSGPLTVGICAEYDALPGIGHACGHNIIAAAAVGAAAALAPICDDLGITLVVIGTPAEERGGGKVLLLDAGAFDDLDLAMMVHPAPADIERAASLAVRNLAVHYTGKASHASAAPQAGINAADAQVVAQVAIGLLRQHLRRSDQVHGIVTDGGEAPNVVPSSTTACYCVRSPRIDRLEPLRQRVEACFEAGATATGCEVEIHPDPAYAELLHDSDIGACYRAAGESIGRSFLDPPGEGLPVVVGSTDMGNVSHLVPTIHPMIAIDSRGAMNHQAAFAEAAASASGDQAVIDGARLLARTVASVSSSDTLTSRLHAQRDAR